MDYLAHLVAESARFRAALGGVPSGAPVPSCPGWDADDLLWHLGEVQWFWGEVVRSRAEEPDAVEERKPARPAHRAGLDAFFAQAGNDLVTLLGTTAPHTRVWTWADDHSVAFVLRRQAHEALIHRLDAELTAGSPTSMDAALSADGVDEVLRLMLGGVPPWGTFTADAARTARVRTTDTGHSWRVSVGRFTGQSPRTGTVYDDPAFDVARDDDAGPVAAVLSGAAADLDAMLWNRPHVGAVDRLGDPATLEAFDAVVAQGVQ